MAKKNRPNPKQKLRTSFRKNRSTITRDNDLTRKYDLDDGAIDDLESRQQVSGKGQLTRKRTIAAAEVHQDATGTTLMPSIDRNRCLPGRVLRVQGLVSTVRLEDGTLRRCAIRRLLKPSAPTSVMWWPRATRSGCVPREPTKESLSAWNPGMVC